MCCAGTIGVVAITKLQRKTGGDTIKLGKVYY